MPESPVLSDEGNWLKPKQGGATLAAAGLRGWNLLDHGHEKARRIKMTGRAWLGGDVAVDGVHDLLQSVGGLRAFGFR